MGTTRTKIGHGLAKALGIKLDYRNETKADRITRGESVFSITSADTFVEEEPTVMEWISDTAPSRQDALNYFRSLFPFTRWITRYNLSWFTGDLVAGITIGAVVVPQGMAYASLAELPVYYGLYTSFMGVLLYWFFATSKDITIGVSFRIYGLHVPLLTNFITACRGHVHYRGQCRPCRRKDEPGNSWPCDRIRPGSYSWCNCLLPWPCSSWVDCRFHLSHFNLCIHHWFCDQHRSWSGPDLDGYFFTL